VVAHAAMGHDAPTSQDPSTGNGGDSNSIAVVRNGSCTNGGSAMFGRPAATGTMSPSGLAKFNRSSPGRSTIRSERRDETAH